MDGRHIRRNWSLVFCMVLASVVLAPAASAANNCNRFEHYDNPNRTGVLIACTPYCATMGIMNDRATSLWWKHA